MKYSPSPINKASAMLRAGLFAFGFLFTLGLSSLQASENTYQINISVPEKIEANKNFDLTMSALDQEGHMVSTDSESATLIISKWEDKKTFELTLKNGTAIQSLSLDKVGNWIATVNRGEKVLYTGRIKVEPAAETIR